jgi:hypothetical protein
MMERLYYEKPSPKKTLLQADAEPVSGPNFNDYLTKVSRLIPSEILAGYLTMIGFVSSIKNQEVQNVVAWIVFAAGLVLTPIYLNKVADANRPKRNHLILSTIAFIIWAYVTTGKQLLETISPDIFDQSIASIALVLFTLISAVIPLDK